MMSSFEPNPISAPTPFVAEPLPRATRAFRSDAPADAHAERPEDVHQPSHEEAVRTAYDEGFAAGRETLPWEEADALKSAFEALRRASRSLAELRRDYLRSERTGLIELALAIAGRLVGREISADRTVLAQAVERALALLPQSAPAELHLSHPDHELLRTGLAPELADLVERGELQVAVDPELQAGDARISVGATSVDARVGAMLSRVREELLPLVDLEPEADAEEPEPGADR